MARGSRQRSTSRMGMEGGTNHNEEADHRIGEIEVRNAFPPSFGVQINSSFVLFS
jgi:hypothetical protein